ncbi:ALQxL family class IV lanthipeptide [Corynebacterium durum]
MTIDITALQELPAMESSGLSGPGGCCTTPIYAPCPPSFATCFGCTVSHA